MAIITSPIKKNPMYALTTSPSIAAPKKLIIKGNISETSSVAKNTVAADKYFASTMDCIVTPDVNSSWSVLSLFSLENIPIVSIGTIIININVSDPNVDAKLVLRPSILVKEKNIPAISINVPINI